MPIYSYICDICCAQSSRILPVSCSDQPCLCTDCGGVAKKLLTAPASIRMGHGTTRRDSGMNRSEA